MKSKPRKALGGALCRRFLVPPFSILDARQGYWQKRKAAWIALGIHGQRGRADELTYDSATSHPGFYLQKRATEERLGRRLGTPEFREKYFVPRGRLTGTSVFDPVLAELVYRWFCVPGGSVLDPFAGESTKGVVAAYLGYQYTGIELRHEQIRVNQAQSRKIGVRPRWIKGDSLHLARLLPRRTSYDLVFTSPPYYNLEVYSSRKDDGSAFQTYEGFLEWLAHIFRQAAERLKDDRFFVVKVGEIRDRRGACRNFVGDAVACLRDDCGLTYVNEAILVTPASSLPIRAPRPFAVGRKLGKTHQNLLVFYKGEPREICHHFLETIEYADLENTSQAPAR